MDPLVHDRISLSLAFALTFLFSVQVLAPTSTPTRQVVFWNAGQGDFISIIDDRHTCLFIDSGGSGQMSSRYYAELKRRCPLRDNWLFVSHFDQDHIRNYQRLARNVPLSGVFVSHADAQTRQAQYFLQWAKTLTFRVLRAGDTLTFHSTHIACLWPDSGLLPSLRHENDRSMVLRVKVPGRKFLFTGDLPQRFEHLFLARPIDVLKVGHHGSHTSTSREFLAELKPKICIISVGVGNRYGHPHRTTLKRLAASHCNIMRTDQLGTIRIGF